MAAYDCIRKESLKRQQAYRVINEAARAVGIKERIGTHTLRRTFGYPLINQELTSLFFKSYLTIPHQALR
ncbi:tyrosine-type recombinase/integrase [Jeotgalibacillus marinus]|uniref:Tyrosine-type recombinase/integrase n=1 Tax=Jeotgalibacillus marinus TaxID=86667 RepID=A0ABV3Q566_9BACL